MACVFPLNLWRNFLGRRSTSRGGAQKVVCFYPGELLPLETYDSHVTWETLSHISTIRLATVEGISWIQEEENAIGATIFIEEKKYCGL